MVNDFVRTVFLSDACRWPLCCPRIISLSIPASTAFFVRWLVAASISLTPPAIRYAVLRLHWSSYLNI